MPFLLYRTRSIEGACEYYDPKHVVLAGRGLIQTTWRSIGAPKGGWTISGEQMLAFSDYAHEEPALVVDTSPNRDTVNLFEITAVSGFCYDCWTPIMITFEQLFADEDVSDGHSTDAQMFKQKFRDTNCGRDKVRSILYLKGGWESGDWNWGGNSRTTAALLWQDAWNYFCAR